MIDKIYFIYSAIFSFSGFAIGFYGTMAQYKIEKIITNAKNLGFDSDSDLWSELFAKKIEKWKAGEFFDSQLSTIVGLLIAFSGAGLNLVYNNWWTSILLLLISYIVYLQAVDLLKWKIQILSLLTLSISIILIIIKLI